MCKQDLAQIPGMNLIDCENMIIAKAVQGMRWIALSYVWGIDAQVEDCQGYREGSGVSFKTPETIKDGIRVTLQLGYRYLWVNEYCIDQRDDNHRQEQIGSMDQIYRGADLTIVAAAGDSKIYGLPGVASTKRKDRKIVHIGDVVVFSNGPRPDREVKETKWFTRAW